MKDFEDFLESHPEKHAGRIVHPDNGVQISFDLPAENTTRWTARRKAEVVAAVEAGMLSIPDACRRYRLSPEEYLEWERHYKVGDWVLTQAPRSRRAFH